MNAHEQRAHAQALDDFWGEPGDDEPDLAELAVRVEDSGPLNDFMHAVSRAASELEGQGEKSDRIAQQLLTALAIFQKETELP